MSCYAAVGFFLVLQNRTILLTEELLEKIILAKTKH
jgi:hypothetical protein